MQITKIDVLWNYAATFLKIASSSLLLPFILKMMSSETVGIWIIFITITAFSSLLDFGFSSSFTRNITYVFSGVKTLKINGFETVTNKDFTVDFGLLKGVIFAMRWFYLRMAIVLFFLLTTIGTYYIYNILQDYNGEHEEVYISWALLCLISTYNLYTLYYDSLLQGKGLIKKSKQITIIGQLVYLAIAAILIINGYGLIAIVSAQASSVIIIRLLSYYSFFNNDMKDKLSSVIIQTNKEIIKIITPNAVKVGLTSLGAFLVLKSSIIIGSLNLSLNDIASYGITMQLIAIIGTLGGIYTATYQPKIAQLRIANNKQAIKMLYLKGQLILILTYVAGSIVLLMLGNWGMNLIDSKTQLIPNTMISIIMIISFLESNHGIAGGILLTKNEVPFFKASIFSGLATVLLLFLLFEFWDFGIWVMILAPGIAQATYQNWKWPLVVYHELEINIRDILKVIKFK